MTVGVEYWWLICNRLVGCSDMLSLLWFWWLFSLEMVIADGEV